MTQSSTDQTTAIERLRDLIEIEIETGLAYREAKGRFYLGLIETGNSAAAAWQTINSHPDMIELERAHLLARAERLCQYLAIARSPSSVPSLGLDWEAPDDD